MLRPLLCHAAGFLAGAFVSICLAQDDAVVVTATRFPDAKRDLPVGITVISADDIRKSASSNLGDILAQFGLLQTRDLAGTQNQQLDLRGFGITGDQNTLVLLDGLRISENELESAQLSSIPIDAIERIEIVRGSGAVQYGSGATGGTINIITRRPQPGESRGQMLGRFGGYGTHEARAAFDRGGELFGGGIAASYEDTDGYRANSRYRQKNVAGRLDAKFGSTSVYARLSADEQRARLPGRLTEAQIAADPRQTVTPDDWREREGSQLVIGGAQRFGRHEASADLSYRTKHSRFAAVSLFGAFEGDTNVDQWLFTPRAKFAYDALGRTHDLIVGMDFEGWDYGSASTFAGAPSAQLTSEQHNSALYAQTNFWLTPSTRAVLAGRTQRLTQRLTLQFPPSDERTGTNRLEAYEAALRHAFGASWSGYGKYGKGFRVATFDENACFFPPCGNALLEPQTSVGGELGMEYESGRVRSRISVYQMNLENEIYFSPLVPPFGQNVNLSPTRRRGVELEGFWRSTEMLDLRAGLALLQAKFRSGVYGGVDVSGNTVPLVPKVLATAGASWRFVPRTRLNANLRYVGEQHYDNDQANTFGRTMPTYTLVDLKLEHRMERRWDFALEVRNLFDKPYFSYGAVDPANPTSYTALPAPGRAAYASVAWRLD
jgi:iron complex outermembrane recepter protein